MLKKSRCLWPYWLLQNIIDLKDLINVMIKRFLIIVFCVILGLFFMGDETADDIKVSEVFTRFVAFVFWVVVVSWIVRGIL